MNERIYLHVSPEEYAEVKALGARWDAQSKCWYLGPEAHARRFQRWLGTPEGNGDHEQFTIHAQAAYVASAPWRCSTCRASMQVVCLYCQRGSAWGEPLEHFTVQDVWALDGQLARQLQGWPGYRRSAVHGCYLNYCPRCAAPQDDAQLHSEPDQPFFDLPGAGCGSVTLTPLAGPVRLSGDYRVDA